MRKWIFLSLLVVLVSSCAVKVACVGDSITEGSGLKQQSKHSYPVALSQLLGDKYQVLNAGRSGATLQKAGDLSYWDCNEFSNVFAFRPKVIIIKLGTNDTKPQNWKLGNFEKDYQALIDTFNTIKPRPKIYLCKPVPAFDVRWSIDNTIIVNSVIPAVERLAAKNKLPLIDLYTPMQSQKDKFPDMIHPNETGAAIMAEIIYREIKK